VNRLRLATAIAACAAAVALPACGSDEKPASGATTPADATSTPTPDRPALAY